MKLVFLFLTLLVACSGQRTNLNVVPYLTFDAQDDNIACIGPLCELVDLANAKVTCYQDKEHNWFCYSKQLPLVEALEVQDASLACRRFYSVTDPYVEIQLCTIFLYIDFINEKNSYSIYSVAMTPILVLPAQFDNFKFVPGSVLVDDSLFAGSEYPPFTTSMVTNPEDLNEDDAILEDCSSITFDCLCPSTNLCVDEVSRCPMELPYCKIVWPGVSQKVAQPLVSNYNVYMAMTGYVDACGFKHSSTDIHSIEDLMYVIPDTWCSVEHMKTAIFGSKDDFLRTPYQSEKEALIILSKLYCLEGWSDSVLFNVCNQNCSTQEWKVFYDLVMSQK